ncbi:MAG: ABC transporter permease, partial [Spirochaetota bacterium]
IDPNDIESINVLKRHAAAPVIPFMGNDAAQKKIIADNFRLLTGKIDDVTGKEGVMVSSALAKKLGIVPGKKIEIRFQPRFEKKTASFLAEVKGVYRADKATGPDTVYMQESLFYPHYYENLPDQTEYAGKVFYPEPSAPFYAALGKEFVVLDRSRTTEEMQKKQKAIAKKKIRATTIDVNSMYESASDVLKLEGALNLITLGAVLVLFFIILIGVINTLRMTIRERTREIGTIRAIGMQKTDVRRIFVLETGFLTLFASIAGTVLAFIVMGILTLIPFSMGDNPMGILLVNGHLHFMPTLSGVFGNIALIFAIALFTAFFPARRAAQMSAAEALRHYE